MNVKNEDNSTNDCSTVLREGYLNQKSLRTRIWKTRWAVLKVDCLEYYKKRCKQLCSRISLVNCSITNHTEEETKREHTFKIVLSKENRAIIFQAASLSEKNYWICVIGAAIREIMRKPFDPNNLIDFGLNLSDILVSMEDSTAGLQLKRRNNIRCFSGKDAIDWLLNWHFAASRLQGLDICQRLTTDGYFQQIEPLQNSTEFQDKDFVLYAFSAVSNVQRLSIIEYLESSSETSESTSSGEESGDNQDRNYETLFVDIIRVKSNRRRNWRVRRAIFYKNLREIRLFSSGKSLSTDPKKALKVINLKKAEGIRLECVKDETITSKQNHVLVIKINRLRPVLIQCDNDFKRDQWIKLINKEE